MPNKCGRYTRDGGQEFMVVDAEKRGDSCFIGRTGFYWYEHGPKMEIDYKTVSGPFRSAEAAYQAGLEGLKLTPLNPSDLVVTNYYVMSQTQVNRIREICQAGTQAHGDEFYGQIMDTLDH